MTLESSVVINGELKRRPVQGFVCPAHAYHFRYLPNYSGRPGRGASHSDFWKRWQAEERREANRRNQGTLFPDERGPKSALLEG